MADFSVEWTSRAKIDMQNIYDYAALHSTSYAQKLILKIISRESQLSSFPASGKIEESLNFLEKEYRFLTEGNHKIIFQIKGHFVYVIRVFDARQNPQKLIV
jgi:plasmid stabilization system protein ParE